MKIPKKKFLRKFPKNYQNSYSSKGPSSWRMSQGESHMPQAPPGHDQGGPAPIGLLGDPVTGINPGKSHGQGPWVSWRKHRLDDKLVGKQEDTFLLDILMMVMRLQGMPRP